MLQYTDENRKFDYVDTAISQVIIDADEYGTFALVPSASSDKHYQTSIDESTRIPHATSCNCDYYTKAHKVCQHMHVTDSYYLRIAGIFAKDELVVELTPDEIAAQSEDRNMQKLAEYRRHIAENAYEALASTKQITYAFGSCGHIVKIKDAGDECGACRCKHYA